MTRLFCPGCGADVDDVGGFCLLGHRLAGSPMGLEDLHAEIATAFEAAKGKVENALRLSTASTPMPSGRLAMEEAPAEDLPAEHRAPSLVEVPPPVGATPGAPPPPPSNAPPPPPAPSRIWGQEPPSPPDIPHEKASPYWDKVWGPDSPEDVLSDPITAFAPAPSMNWGPEQQAGRPKRRFLRKGA